ncbi:MAG: hypothetical protein U1F71_01815 [Verrucomicrobiaceae bacterium]
MKHMPASPPLFARLNSTLLMGTLMAFALVGSLSSCVAPASGTTNISGSYSGGYTYGSGYSANLTGTTVPFNVSINQAAGAASFSGVINEPYSGFGTARDGKLWADIQGTCSRGANGSISVSFQKTYRYFSQDSVSYRGTVSPGSRKLTGTWWFASQPDLTGTFVVNQFPLR